MKKIIALVIAGLLFAACGEDGPVRDPYHCDADDIDGDGDGRCNE